MLEWCDAIGSHDPTCKGSTPGFGMSLSIWHVATSQLEWQLFFHFCNNWGRFTDSMKSHFPEPIEFQEIVATPWSKSEKIDQNRRKLVMSWLLQWTLNNTYATCKLEFTAVIVWMIFQFESQVDFYFGWLFIQSPCFGNQCPVDLSWF